MNKKANVTIYFVIFIVCVIILVMAAVMAPAGVMMTSELYVAGEQMLLDANQTLGQINDVAVRSQLQNATAEALDSAEFNIEVQTDIFQYSWIIAVLLVGFIAFLFTRSLVERQQLGGGGFI